MKFEEKEIRLHAQQLNDIHDYLLDLSNLFERLENVPSDEKQEFYNSLTLIEDRVNMMQLFLEGKFEQLKKEAQKTLV